MQSDSDSDGEFFDAAESPSSSFTCELSKSKGSQKTKKESEGSADKLHVSQGKPHAKEDRTSSGDRTVPSLGNPGQIDENQVLSEQDINKAENVDQSAKPGHQAHGDQVAQKLDFSHETATASTVDDSDGVTSKKKNELTEDRTCEKVEESDKCESKRTEQELACGDATTKVTGIPSARDVVADVVGKVSEETCATPVAPPRRRKKKRVAAAAEAEEPFSLEAQSAADKENTQPSEDGSDLSGASSIHQNFIKPKGLYEPSAGSDDEDNPSIKVDANQQEMKEVLARNNSTEVVSAARLDERLKSPSATSLDSSKSDNYKSAASFTSIDGVKQASSFSSMPQPTPDGMVRYRSVSGRPLSDIEILEQVQVKNLDTGEAIPLSKAEECLPKCSNPLSMHIMRLTSEYSSSPDVSVQDREDGGEQVGRKVAKKTKRLKKFLGKTVNKIKSEVKVRQREDSSSSDEEGPHDSPASLIKIKSGHGKGPAEFERLRILQDLSKEHVGAVWTIKFSGCGRLMATAGQDHMVRVWVLKEALGYFEEMKAKYKTGEQSSPTNSETNSEGDTSSLKENEGTDAEAAAAEDDPGPFEKTPFCTYYGHSGDVLDLSWSKNYFLLSSSMDKTVRLWHISRSECLCCFQHIDFVTAIVFHPRDDRYFLSGSLDGKIRLWNIPDKKVALWNEVEGTGNNLITAANFCLNGKYAVVGTYDGRCIFYETERLKYHTQWHIKTSRNRKARGRKISGIEPMPGEDKVLITSNDSRLRLYDLKDNSLYCKYKGCTNTSSQIKGSFSHDGSYLICGSEDRFVYVWRTQHGIASARRDKNEFYESFSAHDAAVTAAVFAPVPWLIIPPDEVPTGLPVTSEVLVTADWSGAIKLFVNR